MGMPSVEREKRRVKTEDDVYLCSTENIIC